MRAVEREWHEDVRPPAPRQGPSPAEHRPSPLFPEDPPPVAADRDDRAARDEWRPPFDDRPGADDRAALNAAAPWSDRHPADDDAYGHARTSVEGAPHDAEATQVDPSDQQAESLDPRDGRAVHGEPDEIETPVSVRQRVRGIVDAAMAALRSSVPVRTVLLLLPPLVLPPLAFDLSFGAALVVWLLLLWLVGSTAVVTTLMTDGADLLAMRAIGRHLEQLAAGVQRPAGRPADDEALLVVGEQLDALNDRLDALETRRPASASGPIDHRPPEQWSASRGVADNDGDDHDVGHGRHWSPLDGNDDHHSGLHR